VGLDVHASASWEVPIALPQVCRSDGESSWNNTVTRLDLVAWFNGSLVAIVTGSFEPRHLDLCSLVDSVGPENMVSTAA
jgi:hypothetical protein